jgi:hypothetical protein
MSAPVGWLARGGDRGLEHRTPHDPQRSATLLGAGNYDRADLQAIFRLLHQTGDLSAPLSACSVSISRRVRPLDLRAFESNDIENRASDVDNTEAKSMFLAWTVHQ